MSELPITELPYFSLPTWYPFLHHITIKSEFIELSQSFVEYLTSDGIVLPQGCQLPSVQQGKGEEEEQEEESWEEDSSSQPQTDAIVTPSFPELLSSISTAITSLGGSGVVPKLNWSVPRDAVWITTTNSLCCFSPAEVILSLKSSDFIAHDISRILELTSTHTPNQDPPQCTLCLRQWRDIHPSSEFRCFVRGREVIGACQRDTSTHYPFLAAQRETLLEALLSFHVRHLRDVVTPSNYTFDVFRNEKGDFLLLDLNPFCCLTDPLMYTWEELGAWQSGAELRLVEAGCMQPSEHQSYRLPKDIVDLSTGEDINKFVDLFHSNALGKS